MRVYLKVKAKQVELKAKKFHEQLKKLALAVVIAEYLLAGGYYLAEDKGLLSFLEPKTIFVYKAQAEKSPVKKIETSQDVIKRVAKEKGFEDVALLLKIAKCESGFDAYAKNSESSARGLYQILDMHGLTEDERYNPEVATAWTIDKIRKAGTKPWNASKHCWSN